MIYICWEHGCNYTQNQLCTFKISIASHVFEKPGKIVEETSDVWDQNGPTSGPTP